MSYGNIGAVTCKLWELQVAIEIWLSKGLDEKNRVHKSPQASAPKKSPED